MAYINGKEVLFASNIHITEGGVKEYTSEGTFNKGDIVAYEGLLYSPLSNGVNGVLPTDETAWRDLTSAKADASRVEELSESISTKANAIEELSKSVSAKADASRVGVISGKVSDLEIKTTTLDSRVTNLENRKIAFMEDKSVAYKKTVPITATGDAQIGRIGGASHIVDLEHYEEFNDYRMLNGTMKSYTLEMDSAGALYEDSRVVFKSDISPGLIKRVTLYGEKEDPLGGMLIEKYYDMTEKGLDFFYVDIELDTVDWEEDGEISTYVCPFIPRKVTFEFNVNQVYVDDYINFSLSAVPLDEWFEPITTTKVFKILSKPAENLIPKIKDANWSSNFPRGIDFTNNLDGSVTMNGQNNTGTFSQWYFAKDLMVDAGRYYVELEGCSDYYRDTFNLYVKTTRDDVKVLRSDPYIDISAPDIISVRIKTKYGNTTRFNNVKFTPVFKKADGVTPIDTFEIPEKILNIERFGEGNPENPNECNYLDLDKKEVVITGYFNGSKWWNYGTPKIYDVSQILTRNNYIKIIAGGDLEFVSDVAKPVPSDVYYMSYISKTTDAEEVTEND